MPNGVYVILSQRESEPVAVTASDAAIDAALPPTEPQAAALANPESPKSGDTFATINHPTDWRAGSGWQ